MEDAPAQQREKYDIRSTVAAPDPTVRRMYMTDRTREYGVTGCKGIESGRSMPHDNECRTKMRARMEQGDDVREGLKKGEHGQDRQFEKAVMRSVGDDPELSWAEEEHRQKTRGDGEYGPRGSEAEREAKRRNQDERPDQGMDHKK